MGRRRQSPANQRRRLAVGAAGSPYRRSAFSRSEPGCRRNRRCRWITPSTRCARPARAFCCNLTTSNGHAIEADGPRHRRRGHCADSRTLRIAAGTGRKPICATRRCWRRPKCCAAFAATSPWPIWAKSAKGGLAYANAAYARATEARKRHRCDRSQPRTARQRRPRRNGARADTRGRPSARGCRSWPAASGGSTTCARSMIGGGSVGIAIDASEADALSCGAGADGGGASPHARSTVVRRRGVRRPAPARLLQRFLSPAVGPRSRLSRRQSGRFQRARSAARRAQAARAAGFPRLEGKAARSLSRGRDRQGHLVSARRPGAQRRHHAQSGRRRHLSVRRRHRKPRSGAAVRRPDPGAARNPRQSRRRRRGVRQQRPRAIVQSGVRENVEAVARGAARAAAYRDRGSLVPAAVR